MSEEELCAGLPLTNQPQESFGLPADATGERISLGHYDPLQPYGLFIKPIPDNVISVSLPSGGGEGCYVGDLINGVKQEPLYVPDDEPGLIVGTHHGFYGIPDTDQAPQHWEVIPADDQLVVLTVDIPGGMKARLEVPGKVKIELVKKGE
jgi:hypothetical protein